jgi:hypothetical protein
VTVGFGDNWTVLRGNSAGANFRDESSLLERLNSAFVDGFISLSLLDFEC